jgi:hypothetical protein
MHLETTVTNNKIGNLYSMDYTEILSCRPLTAAARVRAGVSPVGFVVDKVALEQVFLQVLRVFPVNIIPPWAPCFQKLKKIVLLLIHFIHPHPEMNKRPVKAAAVQ